MSRVAVVGAGLAGLACARALAEAGAEPVVFEASDAVGGRVRTDLVDRFRIDRGFQVLLTAYPEARRVLDYGALDLRPFEAGARVWVGDRFETLGDPFRRPSQAVSTLFADVGSFADKLRVLRLRRSVTSVSDEALWGRPELPTETALRERYGFSDRMVDRFFRPFLGGVLLDPSLSASSRAFEVYFKRFSQGEAAVPALGMQRIPEQMADRLPAGSVRLNTPVASASAREVHTETGAEPFDAVVIAADADASARLLGDVEAPGWRSTVQIAWAAPEAPIDAAVLLLDGDRRGPVNNAQVMSRVAPSYAPEGQALVTASVLGEPPAVDTLDASARAQLRGWFGPSVDAWRLLRVDRVRHALPALASLEPPERPVRHGGLYVAGDWRRNGSINGALVSGRHAAEAVLADL